MDPLSDVLALLKPRSYVSAGFDAGGDWSIRFSDLRGWIKCYAVLSGEGWLSVEGVPEAIRLGAGECFILPSGRSFRLASDLTLQPVDADKVFPPAQAGGVVTHNGGGDFFLVGSRFAVAGGHAGGLLSTLPPVVHIQKEADQVALRWSVELMNARAARCLAGRLADRTTPRPHDVGSGPACALGTRAWSRRRMVLRPCRQANQRRDRRHARRSGVSMDIGGAGGARLHVAFGIRGQVQGEGRGNPDGIPGALAHAARGRQTGGFQRQRFGDRARARLRIRECLQHGVQASHGLFAPPICSGPNASR
jgi:hypothetical protein